MIYKFICNHFPYYRTAHGNWKKSIKRRLSQRLDKVNAELYTLNTKYANEILKSTKHLNLLALFNEQGTLQSELVSVNNIP